MEKKWHFGSTPLHFSGTSKLIPQARAKAVWHQTCQDHTMYPLHVLFFYVGS